MFKGKAILCFYPDGLVQGHFIDPLNSSSPYSLSGILLPDYVDPLHNDCMEKDDFYSILIHSHNNYHPDIKLITRRQRHNDASGMTCHEHELEINKKYFLSFDTEKFYAGSQANRFSSFFNSTCSDLLVCSGQILFEKQESNDLY